MRDCLSLLLLGCKSARRLRSPKGLWCATILIVALVLAFVMADSQHGRAQLLTPAVGSTLWTIDYSPSMPPTMPKVGSGYVFGFPHAPGSVHYVTKRAPEVALGQIITMRFKLEGNGQLLATEGRSSAKVRLFMQRVGDTLTAKEPYKRWWSRAYVELVSPGTFVLSAKIEPGQWSSVFGELGSSAPADFTDSVTHLARLGFTFGGDFAGHGVFLESGTVGFALREYRVM